MASVPHIVVIGGGSTGSGIARDLAMRGLDVTLVEQGNLTHGTTGRMHGLLHSGGRYAVSDQASATECIEENRVLRDIASHCVEMTGGLFVKRPEDSEEYFQDKLQGCEDCEIPAEVVSGEEARAMEPHLATDIDKAISVPDGAVDPFRLVVANAASAQEHGARIETHSKVTDLLVEEMERAGASRRNIKAKIAGGSDMLDFSGDGSGIGVRNVEKVRETLDSYNIPIVGEDVGGDHGRSLRLESQTGDLVVKSADQNDMRL